MGTGARWAGARPAPCRVRALARRLFIFGWPTVLAGLASSRSPCSAIPRSRRVGARGLHAPDFRGASAAARALLLRRADAPPAARGRGCAAPRRPRGRAHSSCSSRRRCARCRMVPSRAAPAEERRGVARHGGRPRVARGIDVRARPAGRAVRARLGAGRGRGGAQSVALTAALCGLAPNRIFLRAWSGLAQPAARFCAQYTRADDV